MSDRPSKRIGDLRRGDRVQLAMGESATITHAALDKTELVMPHRASAPRVKVPAWYVIWRAAEGRDAGGLFDPDDRVFLP